MTNAMPPIAILGAGSWGTALALHLARSHQSVHLWTANKEHASQLEQDHLNKRYLPLHPFPDNLHPTTELTTALQGANDILIAVPSAGFRGMLMQIKPMLKPGMRVAWASKGLDDTTGQLLHEVVAELLGQDYPSAVISGPSFASEVALQQPTAVVIASQNKTFAQDLLTRFNTPLFRVYLNTDVVGVEIGGVVKNVLAIATGISDGMGFGSNARCALITRGLAEMMRLGNKLGGQLETFTGLAGLGDLILTCTDDKSRNRRFGLALGRGSNATQAEKEIGQVVEGKRNAELLVQLAQKNNVEMPITEAVWQILQEKKTSKQAMQDLLMRATTTEKF